METYRTRDEAVEAARRSAGSAGRALVGRRNRRYFVAEGAAAVPEDASGIVGMVLADGTYRNFVNKPGRPSGPKRR